jgi:hypothetical protein
MGKFAPHTILQRKGKRGSVVRGGGEGNMHDRDRRRELEKTMETQRVLNIGEGE